MDNENNYLSDINVGKINFQPMQKRFMVWDEKGRKFVRGINGHILNWREIANLVEPSIWDCAVELDEVVERFTIVQSTNLFDTDGEVALINTANIVVVVEDDNTPYTMLTLNIGKQLVAKIPYSKMKKLLGVDDDKD